MKTSFYYIIIISFAMALFNSCREDEVIYIKEVVPVTQPEFTSVEGFYLLNEGVMQHDLASLDYYNYATGEYMRDVYTDANDECDEWWRTRFLGNRFPGIHDYSA